MPKNNRNKYFLLSALVLFLLFLVGTFSQAATNSNLEVKYPNLTAFGLPSINAGSTIYQYAAYWFGLLIYISGAIAAISFAIGGIQLVASMDNTEMERSGKDRMKGAALGLILTVAAAVVIHTINPHLANLTITPLTQVPGVYLTNSSNSSAPLLQAPDYQNDTSALPAGYDTVKYICPSSNNGVGVPYLIWLFPEIGLAMGSSDQLTSVKVYELNCGGTQGVSASKSFQISLETPGIYYCMDDGCSGNMCANYMSDANTKSQDNISDPFSGHIGGVRIVNYESGTDPSDSSIFGVIFHQADSLDKGGDCTDPIVSSGGSGSGGYTISCESVDEPAYTNSDDIFQVNQDPSTSGTGVTFYSEPFGPDRGARAGYYTFPNDSAAISSTVSEDELAAGSNSSGGDSGVDTMTYDWSNVAEPGTYDTDYPDFQSRPGSIDMSSGSYLVALYSTDTEGDKYCQTFTDSVENLNSQPIIASGESDQGIENVYVIPTQ